VKSGFNANTQRSRAKALRILEESELDRAQIETLLDEANLDPATSTRSARALLLEKRDSIQYSPPNAVQN
jgi:hypothetical protein